MHLRGANGEDVHELVVESSRAPPSWTKSLGWLTRESRAKPAVPFEGDTPKEFTNLLRLANPLKKRKLTIALEDRREYMRTWGKHMAPDIRTILRQGRALGRLSISKTHTCKKCNISIIFGCHVLTPCVFVRSFFSFGRPRVH